jgi:hypothetical protein
LIRFLFDNVRQIEENKYDEMRERERGKQMIDTQKKLSKFSFYASLFFFSLCVSLLRGQTDTRDRPETRVYHHIIRETAASTDGYLFLETCLMFDCARD